MQTKLACISWCFVSWRSSIWLFMCLTIVVDGVDGKLPNSYFPSHTASTWTKIQATQQSNTALPTHKAPTYTQPHLHTTFPFFPVCCANNVNIINQLWTHTHTLINNSIEVTMLPPFLYWPSVFPPACLGC